MPDIVRKAFGYHIYFWSNEGDPIEPIHFHISEVPHKNATKYWILSDGSVALENNNDNIAENDLRRVVRYMSLKRNIAKAKEKWLEHFGELRYIR